MVSSKGSNLKDGYFLGRDHKASTRLNYQHFWTSNLIKDLLHPEIKVDRSDMCIADVGTGTGVWLVDVAQQVPARTKLYGFDLSSAQFPRSEWLPSNVKLIAQDALAEVPSEWHGKFDVVNMRFVLALVGSEAKYKKLISNIRLLLNVSKSAAAQVARLMQKPLATTDYSYDASLISRSESRAESHRYFPVEAQNIAQKHDLQLLSWDEMPIGPTHQSFWNQSNLLALEEMVAVYDQQGLGGEGDNLRQIIDRLRQEHERGWIIKASFFRWVLQVESI
ncbi:MAG: hypothetical protein OHK93_002050 [Ramalina farinacea]|uniref:Methyltransferase domain-containing protein n=1 Tax=Ramalina farinacea TaxID=258253 RepID=A0AA43TYB7_9LECA|nr:hypothetical protein [Ramalina farinacea]